MRPWLTMLLTGVTMTNKLLTMVNNHKHQQKCQDHDCLWLLVHSQPWLELVHFTGKSVDHEI